MPAKLNQLIAFFSSKTNKSKVHASQPVIIRAVFFTFALLFLQFYEFSWLAIIGFWILIALMYLNPLFNARKFFFSFISIAVMAVGITARFAISFPENSLVQSQGLTFSQFVLAIFFGVMFYLLIGVKQLVFIKRKEIYYFLYLTLFYSAFILYFAANKTNIFPGVIKSVLLFGFTLLLIREFFNISGYKKTRLIAIITWTLSLLVLQVSWVIDFLPVEFSSAAGLATLFAFIVSEITRRYLKDGLTGKFLRWNLTAFTVLLVVILIFSRWTI